MLYVPGPLGIGVNRLAVIRLSIRLQSNVHSGSLPCNPEYRNTALHAGTP